VKLDGLMIAAAGGLALFYWYGRKKEQEGAQAVSVTGATVSVENVEAIEERAGWIYSGLEGKLVLDVESGLNMGSRTDAFPLYPGAWYSDKPALPGMGRTEFWRYVPGYTPNRGVPVPGSFYHYTPTAPEWDAAWRREVLTVGQQLANGAIIPVPEAFKP